MADSSIRFLNPDTPLRVEDVGDSTFALGTADAPAAAATLTNVASSASNVTLKAANTARRGLLVVNDSAAILYLKFGATATTSSFTAKIAAGASWEMPKPTYQGIVDGIWASADGAARITELT